MYGSTSIDGLQICTPVTQSHLIPGVQLLQTCQEYSPGHTGPFYQRALRLHQAVFLNECINLSTVIHIVRKLY
jgi:hypothetical protein